MTKEPQFFHDRTGASQDQPLDLWPPVVIPKEEIDAEIERLADLPAPNNGRREALIVHPRARKPGLGLAPGIRVTLSVLKPGEETKAFRHNATISASRAEAPPSSTASASTLSSTTSGTIRPIPPIGTSIIPTSYKSA
jgi:hypothetical protein